MDARSDATRLLATLAAGDASAADELRAVAGNLFRGQDPGHTLQPTALVHDAYVKLIGRSDLKFRDRGHFMATAARAMRQILINHARDRRTAKRGGGARRVTLLDGAVADPGSGHDVDLVELDDALNRLEQLDPRQCRIVELRYFAGLGVQQTAAVLDVSEPTVKRDWRMARAWLFNELLGEVPP